jgi:protein-S-isoprenylcysteine O-methyltransferase Ste14
MTILRHLLAILLLPTVMAGVIPYYILSARPLAAWPPENLPGFAAVACGAVVLALGLALVVTTIRQFATEGRGTLAPWDPPQHFVVTGLYRHVRNPMITGVILVLCGEALLFRSNRVLEWTVTFAVINMVYIPLLEEPMLEARFGEEYREYKRNVRRWIPRLRAWDPRVDR